MSNSCPLCGLPMKDVIERNALSRHGLGYICPDCGTKEAFEDYYKAEKERLKHVSKTKLLGS